jgi:hypothetical protein
MVILPTCFRESSIARSRWRGEEFDDLLQVTHRAHLDVFLALARVVGPFKPFLWARGERVRG